MKCLRFKRHASAYPKRRESLPKSILFLTANGSQNCPNPRQDGLVNSHNDRILSIRNTKVIHTQRVEPLISQASKSIDLSPFCSILVVEFLWTSGLNLETWEMNYFEGKWA